MRSTTWPAQVRLASFGLDGHAGIVAGALAQAGQGVEESGLAGVGIAEQGGGQPSRGRFAAGILGRQGNGHGRVVLLAQGSSATSTRAAS